MRITPTAKNFKRWHCIDIIKTIINPQGIRRASFSENKVIKQHANGAVVLLQN